MANIFGYLHRVVRVYNYGEQSVNETRAPRRAGRLVFCFFAPNYIYTEFDLVDLESNCYLQEIDVRRFMGSHSAKRSTNKLDQGLRCRVDILSLFLCELHRGYVSR